MRYMLLIFLSVVIGAADNIEDLMRQWLKLHSRREHAIHAVDLQR